MGSFFKLFLKGILVTILLPVILLIWLLYGAYCLVLFLVMFVKGVIEFFQGKEPSGEMLEDIESKRTILEKEEADAHAREMVNIMYQNAMAQQQVNNPAVPPAPAPAPVQTYGPDIFNQSSRSEDMNTENNSVEEPKDDSFNG